MARKFKNDHRAKSIRKQIAWQLRNGTSAEQIRANIISKEFGELMSMVDEEIERLEAAYMQTPLTSDGVIGWLPDDFDEGDDDE